jgi:hypothetical protein
MMITGGGGGYLDFEYGCQTFHKKIYLLRVF